MKSSSPRPRPQAGCLPTLRSGLTRAGNESRPSSYASFSKPRARQGSTRAKRHERSRRLPALRARWARLHFEARRRELRLSVYALVLANAGYLQAFMGKPPYRLLLAGTVSPSAEGVV